MIGLLSGWGSLIEHCLAELHQYEMTTEMNANARVHEPGS